MNCILDRVLTARHQALASHPNRPFVCVTWAQSADGMLAAAPGVRTSISGDQSMAMTHMLRAIHDGILVGIGTILADNPRLSCRLKEHDRAVLNAALARHDMQLPQQEDVSPTAVVLDPTLRTPVYSRFLRQPHCLNVKRQPIIFSTIHHERDQDQDERRISLTGLVRFKSVSFEPGSDASSKEGGRSALLCLNSVMEDLRHENMSSVMIEGGAAVLSSFLKSGLCDLVIITIAPTLFGTGLPLAARSDRESFSANRLSDPKWVQCGEDIVLVGTPT